MRPGRHRRAFAFCLPALAVLCACPDGDDDGAPAGEGDDGVAPDRPADGAPAEGGPGAAPPADAGKAAAAHDAEIPVIVLPPAQPVPPAPAGLPPTPSPATNPTTAEKVALGELLFFDPRLSGDGQMSCAHCHDPDQGFADGKRRSRTAGGAKNRRHTPTLTNAGYAGAWFWDGSADTLEGAIASNWRGQMSAAPDVVAAELFSDPTYRAHFERAFGDVPTAGRIAMALAAYVRTIRSGDAAWDRFEAGDRDAVSDAAQEGFRIFSGKAQCAVCHPPPLYTDRRYHHTAAAAGDIPPDPGRYRVTGRASDRGAIRTPTLRGLAHTAPYFHDGSAETLEEAVRIMASGGRDGGGRDLEKVELTGDDIDALVAFLRALSPDPEPYERPELPGR